MTSAIVSGSGRKGRKRSRPAAPSFGWKPVEVTIGDVVPAGSVDVTSDNGDAMASNHYDDDSFAHRASRDLEAEPGEGVGMFYGLEVISGDQYRMITTPHSEGSDPSSITRLLVVNSPDVTTNNVDKNVQTVRKQETPARNKSKKTKKQGDTASQNPNCAPSETRSTEPSATAGRTVETCKHSKSGPVDLTTARNGKISSKALEDDQQSDTGRSVAEGSQGRQRSQQQAQAMQDAWLMQTGGVSLDLAICEALVLQSFWTPTPIQAATLPAAILGRRNVVGAAPTGSGKTLAFLLPVAQFLLQKQESMHINDEATKDDSLQALIVTPTRELALQIHREAVSFLSSSIKKNSGCGVLVGGLAHAKQSRVLASRPPILVATPGRLWELVRTQTLVSAFLRMHSSIDARVDVGADAGLRRNIRLEISLSLRSKRSSLRDTFIDNLHVSLRLALLANHLSFMRILLKMIAVRIYFLMLLSCFYCSFLAFISFRVANTLI